MNSKASAGIWSMCLLGSFWKWLAISFYTENSDCDWQSTSVEVVIHCPQNKCLVSKTITLWESFSPWVDNDSSAVPCVMLLMITRHLNQRIVRKCLESFNSSVHERTRVWRSCKDWCHQILFPCFLQLSHPRSLQVWSRLARENMLWGSGSFRQLHSSPQAPWLFLSSWCRESSSLLLCMSEKECGMMPTDTQFNFFTWPFFHSNKFSKI